MPFLDGSEQPLRRLVLVNVDPAGLEDSLPHLQPLPGRRQVDFVVFVGDLLRPQHLLRRVGDHLLSQFHDLQVIGVSPVKLKLGELGVMLE